MWNYLILQAGTHAQTTCIVRHSVSRTTWRDMRRIITAQWHVKDLPVNTMEDPMDVIILRPLVTGMAYKLILAAITSTKI